MADVDRLIRRHRQHNYMVRTAKFAVGVFDLTRYTPPYIELVLEHMRQIQRGALAIRFLTKRLVRCCFRSQTQEHRKDFIIEDRRYTFVFIDIAESTYLQRIEGERLLYEIDGFIVIISLVDTETTHLVQVLLDRLYYETYWIERFPPQACDDLNSRARFGEIRIEGVLPCFLLNQYTRRQQREEIKISIETFLQQMREIVCALEAQQPWDIFKLFRRFTSRRIYMPQARPDSRNKRTPLMNVYYQNQN